MITLLMAPELLSEIGNVPYIRDATPFESQVFRGEHPNLKHMDDCGRPYFATTIDETHPDCPFLLVCKAKTTLRMRWL